MIEDYQVTIDLAVTEGNGDELVLLWDNGKIVTSDGKNQTIVGWKHFVLKETKLLI